MHPKPVTVLTASPFVAGLLCVITMGKVSVCNPYFELSRIKPSLSKETGIHKKHNLRLLRALLMSFLYIFLFLGEVSFRWKPRDRTQMGWFRARCQLCSLGLGPISHDQSLTVRGEIDTLINQYCSSWTLDQTSWESRRACNYTSFSTPLPASWTNNWASLTLLGSL